MRLLTSAIYLPGAFLVGLQAWAIRFWSATELLNHRLDQIAVGYLALYYVIAAVDLLVGGTGGRAQGWSGSS